jgi:hypothetical protein
MTCACHPTWNHVAWHHSLEQVSIADSSRSALTCGTADVYNHSQSRCTRRAGVWFVILSARLDLAL